MKALYKFFIINSFIIKNKIKTSDMTLFSVIPLYYKIFSLGKIGFFSVLDRDREFTPDANLSEALIASPDAIPDTFLIIAVDRSS